MASEINRESYLDPSGTPLFLIEKTHGDRDGNPVSVWEVRHGGRTIRNEIPDYDTAFDLVEGMGGIRTQAGDARSMAAEIGGTSVMQAAMAPLVTELAEAADNDREKLMTAPDSPVKSRSEVVGGTIPLRDSQATGIVEVTTGLGGLKSHGIAERFEGAADEPVAEALIDRVAEEAEEARQDEKPARSRARARSKAKPKGDTPQTAAGDNTPASASSPSPSGKTGE